MAMTKRKPLRYWPGEIPLASLKSLEKWKRLNFATFAMCATLMDRA
jgi:hypothetical protein